MTKNQWKVEEVPQIILGKLAEFFQVEPIEITPRSSFKNDLKNGDISKISFLSFLVEIEEFFSIIFHDNELREIDNREDLTYSVIKKIN